MGCSEVTPGLVVLRGEPGVLLEKFLFFQRAALRVKSLLGSDALFVLKAVLKKIFGPLLASSKIIVASPSRLEGFEPTTLQSLDE